MDDSDEEDKLLDHVVAKAWGDVRDLLKRSPAACRDQPIPLRRALKLDAPPDVIAALFASLHPMDALPPDVDAAACAGVLTVAMEARQWEAVPKVLEHCAASAQEADKYKGQLPVLVSIRTQAPLEVRPRPLARRACVGE